VNSLRQGKAALAVAVLVAVCMLIATAVFAVWNDGRGDSTAASFDARDDSPGDPSAAAGPDAQGGPDQPWMAYTSEPDENTSPTTTADPSSEEETSPVTTEKPQSTAGNPEPMAKPDLPSDPVQSGVDDPVFSAFVVSGRVHHSVWGTPVSGVRVELGAGTSTMTDAQGRYTLRGVSSSSVVAVAVSGPWLSKQPLTRYVVVADGSSSVVDFTLYGTNEAFGSDWRSARDWRHEPDAALEAAVPRVAAVSEEFASLTTQGARAVLSAARHGSQQESARGELLASWLDLASAQLGFHTPVNVSSTPGGTSALGADPQTALALVQQADTVIAQEGDPDWNRLRKVLTERSLAE